VSVRAVRGFLIKKIFFVKIQANRLTLFFFFDRLKALSIRVVGNFTLKKQIFRVLARTGHHGGAQ
jgi:hypothetical protein